MVAALQSQMVEAHMQSLDSFTLFEAGANKENLSFL